MGGCCAIKETKEIPENNEIKVVESINMNNNDNSNFHLHLNKIEKIQSHFRGMKTRKKFKEKQSIYTNIISNEANLNFTEITSQEYEDFLKLYPPITFDNINNIKTLKNVILNKELYYGEYNIEKNVKEGRGILVTRDGTKYYGYFRNNKKNIKGKLLHYEGDIYEGEWLDDKANGKGKYLHIDGTTYDGNWKNDKQDGYGLETWNDGSYYEGYYVNGKKEGKGYPFNSFSIFPYSFPLFI